MTKDNNAGHERTVGRSALRSISLPVSIVLLSGSASIAAASDEIYDSEIPKTGALDLLSPTAPASSYVVRDSAAGVLPIPIRFAKLSGDFPQDNRSADQSGDKSVSARTKREGDTKRRQRGGGEIEEVIVTAQKRQELLEDVPISISVLSGDYLDSSRVQGVIEALNRVPGVASTVNLLGSGVQLAVRGVTAAGATFAGSSPVAYYLDSVPFGLVKTAIAPDATAFDLQRVEVLRGPQGTLYGASALNGVVRVLTNDADLNEVDFKALTSVSTTEDGAESYRGDMAVNVPIVKERLAARAVVGYQSLGGWIDRPNKKDANDAEISNFRLKVNAQPIDKLSIGLSAWLSRDDSDAPPLSRDDGTHSSSVDEPRSTDYDVYGLKIGYVFPALSIVSMTSYLDYENIGAVDLSTLGLADTMIFTGFGSEVFSQEFQINSNLEGAWRWSVGGIYRDAEDRLYQFRRQYVQPTQQSNVSESVAVFGEVTRTFFDSRLELTGGLRYFEDTVEGRESSRLSGLPAAGLYSHSTFDATSPRAVLTWHQNDQLTMYASYAEGFRSGFDQNPAVLEIVPTFRPVDADSLANYELGAKGTFWEGRVQIDTAVYYVDWEDVQQTLTVLVPPSINLAAVVNGESASGMGGDFSVTTRLAEGLELGAAVSWNDLTMDSDVMTADGILFNKGDRLNQSPEYTVGAFTDYAFRFGATGFEGRFSASANYTSEMEVRSVFGGVQDIVTGDAMLIGRASFSVVAPDHWEMTLFIDNINDERGSPLPSPVTDWSVRVRPRTVGLQLEYRL